MICIPYIINDSYYVARLSGEQESMPYYIIETDSTDKIELFMFEACFSAFDPNSGMGQDGQNDYQFIIREDKCIVDNNPRTNTADITIAVERKANRDVLTPIMHYNFNKNGLGICQNRITYDLREIKHDPDKVSTINICLFDVTDQLRYDFGINVADEDHICDIVIDFGSEASQIWTYCRGNGSPWHNGNQMPLYDNIKETNVSLTSVDNKAIYQFDENGRNLFKSLFFIKKSVGNVLTDKDFVFINKKVDLLTILQNMLALPNLKLMEHEDVPVPSFSFNGTSISIFQKRKEIRAEILKFFFRHALRNVNKMAGKEMMACKLTFLVPNTYKQDMLADVFNDLVNDINTLFKENEPDKYTQIKQGIEVTTFSESDASFFGWYTPSIFLENGPERILVVDIGKGTTDFSVLDVRNGNGPVEVERIARSGFVGAGNVMTFAILVTTFKSLAEKKGGCHLAEIVDAIKDIAYHNDYAKKDKLNGYLEQLKRNQYIDGREKLHGYIMSYPGTIKNLSDITIDKLSDILKGACEAGCYIDDKDPVVSNYANLLADQLIDELKYVYDENIPLDRVVFFGRGAMSLPLRTTIEKQLRDINKRLQTSELTGEIKTGCLKGPLNESLIMDHMNMAIVGWPQQKNPKQQRRTNNVANDERRWKKYFKWISELIADEPISTTENAENEIEEMRRLIYKKVVSSDFRTLSMIQGQKVTVSERDNFFVLGNRRCHIDLRREEYGEKHIFYDGENFVARDANGSYEFVCQEAPDDDRFITETFFPMTAGNPENVNLPMVERILTQISPVIVDDKPSTKGVSKTYNDDEDFTAN